jgi:hypothetical protein
MGIESTTNGGKYSLSERRSCVDINENYKT